MASAEVQESLLLDAAEFDSESCSSDDRCTNKRVGADFESAGPKKRRKQTTPVRLPSSLMTSGRHESEDEAGDNDNLNPEGKMINSPQSKSLHAQSAQDENRDAQKHCHMCDLSFDNKTTLSQHLECEHFIDSSQQMPLKAPNLIKQEIDASNFSDQSTSPVNLSSINMKNFSWMPTQPLMATQIQKDDWLANSPRLVLPEHMQGLPPLSGALTQYLHYPGFPLQDANQMPPRTPLGPVPPRIFNRDAYCELCNKEFCNKYFLKTHKANKHGIYSDTSSQSSTGDAGVVAPVSFSLNNVKTEQVQLPESNATSPFATSPKPSISCDICQQRFKSDELVNKHKQQVHEEVIDSREKQVEDKRDNVSSQSPSVMEMLFKQEYGPEQEEGFSPGQRLHQVQQQAVQLVTESGLSIEQLRKLGVINSETFCDICCKEFNNKFVLQAHKIKQHGLFFRNNDKTTVSWHNIQTSPLNLIVNESDNNLVSNNRDDDYECKICGIRFQTIELYDIHRQRIHDEKLKSPLNDLESSNHKVDTISEDLQKLQTMILQLNGLESYKSSTLCSVCGTEFENRAVLQMHMSAEHDYLTENTPPPQDSDKSPSNGITCCCTMCEKEFTNEDALRKHITEEHPTSAPNTLNLPQMASTVLASSTPKQPPQPERKGPASMTPTSSYCEICNKELCNKYFMKTHMHRMHGIEISNGAQIGGVICNICNKELCSKYFLRVHKHNTHGIIDESTPVAMKQDTFDTSNSEDNSLKPDHPNDLSNRYFSHFTEVCPICNRRFRSVKWLKAHLLGDHGKTGVEKWREFEEQYPVTRIGTRLPNIPRSSQPSPSLKIPNGQEVMQQSKIGDIATLGTQVFSNLFGSPTDDQRSKSYRCSLCNFTTTALPFLFLHERSHTNPAGLEGMQSLQCPICSQVFSKLELLHHHLLSSHQFPGILSQFQSPSSNNYSNKESKEYPIVDTKPEKKQEMGYANESQSLTSQKADPATIEVTPQGAYKCAQCGFATSNLNRIKKHVKKDHKSIGDVTDSVIAELSRTLKEVANKHKVPASYAMPQDLNSNPDKTIMQPFLIEEFNVGVQGIDDCSSIKRFSPALVYLPVKTRVNSVLTASFTLSPA